MRAAQLTSEISAVEVWRGHRLVCSIPSRASASTRRDLSRRAGLAALVAADLLLISTGLMTMRALDAAKRLEADHLDVGVLHVPTIKPLDREAILREAAGDRLVVTLENHTIVGGLGEAVASCLAFTSPCSSPGLNPPKKW